MILFTEGQELRDQDVIEAATIAASFCRSGDGGKVEIDYAPRKNVWKPNGARPGMVTYEHYWSVIVSPNMEWIEKFRRINKVGNILPTVSFASMGQVL